jgi:hypothetical protein
MTNHAQKLIEATEKHTLRPQKDDRARVIIEVLNYLIENFALAHQVCDNELEECQYSGTYIDVENLHDLHEKLKEIVNG